jgi:hypothetical protein
MSLRSVLLGLLGALFLCSVTYFSDRVLHQTDLIGNNFPVSVYGGLLLFLLLLRPWFRPLALRGRELAVVLAIVLAACCIPGSGLLRFFTPALVMPHHYNRVEPGWAEEGVLDMAPAYMLVDPGTGENRVVDGFRQGLSDGDRHLAPGEVPWRPWLTPLRFWGSVLLVLWLSLIALSLVLHRQWSSHEHLPYPIAAFADSLLPTDSGRNSPILHSRLFWIGAVAVFLLHANNFAYLWFPEVLVPVKRQFDLTPLHRFAPALVRGGGYGLLVPTFYFSVIGLTFFIPTDVSFSLGIGPYLWHVVVGLLVSYGIQLDQPVDGRGWYLSLKPKTFLLFGANLAFFLGVLYTGRHHLLAVVRRCAGLRSTELVTPTELWASRAFAGLSLIFMLLMWGTGVDPVLALAYWAVLMVFYVVMGRLIAETGLFYMQPFFFPCVVVWGLLGSRALGVRDLLLLQLFSMILVIDPRESIMPFMVNSFKLLERRKVPLARTAAWCALAVVIGLAVAVTVCLYIQYDQGAAVYDGWGHGAVPKFPFDNAVAVQQRLGAQGVLEGAGQATGVARLLDARPERVCVWAGLAGFAAAAAFATARLRIPGWPIHPLLFVTWATFPTYLMCASFLTGWILKATVTRYGGTKLYNRLKPLIVGVIAGEVLGAILPSLVGAVYFIVTGDPPKAFHVLP